MTITSSKAVSNLFFIMAILFLISCASHHKPNDEISYQYKCVDGGEFTAIVHQDKDQTIIRMGENQYILDITPSASGSKYSDGMNTFWSKGNEAMLELSDGKSYKECEVVE
ncbi:MAG: MliC family protein [Thermodesulfobacteriota bacterium]